MNSWYLTTEFESNTGGVTSIILRDFIKIYAIVPFKMLKWYIRCPGRLV